MTGICPYITILPMKMWLITASLVIVLVGIGSSIAIGVIRLCIASDASAPMSFREIICGNDLNAGRVGFKKLTAESISVASNITESKEFSIDRDNDAAKLVDGKKNTLAAPANQSIEYILTLTEPHRIRQTIITWGDYGVNTNYISNWTIETSLNGETWTKIKQGASPKESETIINEDFTALKIRIKAQSVNDWIGIYEMELIGRPL